jgi:hypothetical protein
LGLLAAAVIISAGVVVAVFLTRDRNVVVGDAVFPSAMASSTPWFIPGLLVRRRALAQRAGRRDTMLGLSLEDLGMYSDRFADGRPAV